MMDILDKLNDEVLQKLRDCKTKKTCKDLPCRAFYFEPNKDTIKKWREEELYIKGIDRRVIFVCESPGPKSLPEDGDIDIKRCWGKENAKQSYFPFRNLDRFLKIRKDNGLENCYITNIVKCGPKNGAHHRKEEKENCSRFCFLKEEIKIIHPEVVVAVGGEVAHILQKYYKKFLEDQDFKKPHKIAHYAFRGSNEKLWENYWDKEFKELQKIISPTPEYIPIK